MRDAPYPDTGREVLRTARLRLREFSPEEDAGFVMSLLNSPGWLQHIGDRGVREPAQARQWISERLVAHYRLRGYGFWAVQRLSDGASVGLCGLIHREGLVHPDLGYALLPAHQGQGYAREAAAACLAHGHQSLAMPCVLAITGLENHPSAAVLRDIGMRETGRIQLPGEEATPALRLFASETPAG